VRDYSEGQKQRIVLAAEGVAHEQARLLGINDQLAALRAERLALRERLRDKSAALNEAIVAAQTGHEPLPSLFESFRGRLGVGAYAES
jgi:hypothetical protein